MKLNIISFDTINSTNSYLKENYSSLSDNTVCITKTQTNGRGRFGRVWQDNQGSALFSILIKRKIENITIIPLISAYAILKVLGNYSNNLKVKWPNDILLNSKKLVGVLVEGVSTDKIEAIVIGIGINVNNKNFNPAIKDIATSLFIETNQEYNINEIIINISELISDLINSSSEENLLHVIINCLNEYSYLKDKEVEFTYQGSTLKGVVQKINEDGSLKIVTNDIVYNVSSGEVTLTNIYRK